MLNRHFAKLRIIHHLKNHAFTSSVLISIKGVIMSHLISENIHVIENDLEAIHAAYHVADFALEGRNERD